MRLANLDYHDALVPASRRASRIRRGCGAGSPTLEKEMKAAAKDLDFEKAAALRDELRSLRELQIFR